MSYIKSQEYINHFITVVSLFALYPKTGKNAGELFEDMKERFKDIEGSILLGLGTVQITYNPSFEVRVKQILEEINKPQS